MRVIHIVPAVSQEASGPSYSVVRLCESLIRTGVDTKMAALDWSSSQSDLPFLKTFPLGRGPRRLGGSPSMLKWLKKETNSGRVNLIHNHSLWMMPNVYSGWVCGTGHCRLVLSPRGTLSGWSLRRSALAKKIFWCWRQARALRTASCFHATAESEFADIRRLGFKQPVCIIPNGIDVPPVKRTTKDDHRQLLFLGRIHPVKGVDILLRAWAAVEHEFPHWDLKIVGPDNGCLTEMQALSNQLKLKRVAFRGPLYGQEKLRAYQSADLFVLPTHSENFGMTVAESLAAGTPAIVTKGAPWRELEKRGAGWWIDIGLDHLTTSLRQALATPPIRLEQMGRNGIDWMLQEYSWDRIGEQLSSVYRWLLEGGEIPPCVRLD